MSETHRISSGPRQMKPGKTEQHKIEMVRVREHCGYVVACQGSSPIEICLPIYQIVVVSSQCVVRDTLAHSCWIGLVRHICPLHLCHQISETISLDSAFRPPRCTRVREWTREGQGRVEKDRVSRRTKVHSGHKLQQ